MADSDNDNAEDEIVERQSPKKAAGSLPTIRLKLPKSAQANLPSGSQPSTSTSQRASGSKSGSSSKLAAPRRLSQFKIPKKPVIAQGVVDLSDDEDEVSVKTPAKHRPKSGQVAGSSSIKKPRKGIPLLL